MTRAGSVPDFSVQALASVHALTCMNTASGNQVSLMLLQHVRTCSASVDEDALHAAGNE